MLGTRGPRTRWWSSYLLLLLLVAVLGCAAPGGTPPATAPPAATVATVTTAALPTPTCPTDYVPPATPAPRATSPATPRPSQSPLPCFPAEAVVPEGYPALPADLYFLRDNRLWRWPAAGGRLEVVAQEGEAVPIVGYWPAEEGRRVAYLSGAAILSIYDRSTNARFSVPTRGILSTAFDRMGKSSHVYLQEYALTPDGRYLLYLAWGAAPGEAAGDMLSAALLAVDVQDPEQAVVLGACVNDMSDWWQPYPCLGFSLAPDGRQVAFSDKSGLWVAEVPGGNARLLVERSDNIMPPLCDVNYPRVLRWSPDGRWLLAQVGCYEGNYWTVVDAVTGQLLYFAGETFCYVGCRNEARWGPAGLWMGEEQAGAVGDWLGHLALFAIGSGDTLEVTRLITQTTAGTLRPAAVYPFPDGRVGFAHRGCLGATGPAPAIMVLAPDGELTEVAQLPAVPCRSAYGEDLLWQGPRINVLWSADGATFLYLEEESPVLLGLTDGSALWDVRAVLQGARQFRWVGGP